MPCGACCGATGLSYGYGFGNQTFVDSLYPSQWDVPGMTLDEFSQKLAQGATPLTGDDDDLARIMI
jgi:hypothetical protein